MDFSSAVNHASNTSLSVASVEAIAMSLVDLSTRRYHAGMEIPSNTCHSEVDSDGRNRHVDLCEDNFLIKTSLLSAPLGRMWGL